MAKAKRYLSASDAVFLSLNEQKKQAANHDQQQIDSVWRHTQTCIQWAEAQGRQRRRLGSHHPGDVTNWVVSGAGAGGLIRQSAGGSVCPVVAGLGSSGGVQGAAGAALPPGAARRVQLAGGAL